MNVKRKLALSASLFVLSVLLISAAGALAAPGDAPFTLVGMLSVTGIPEVYSVGGQTFVVDAATVCTDLTPTTVSCASLNGQLVQVAGYISATDTLYYATSITAQAANTTFTYVGELSAYSDTSWTVGAYTFVITSTTSIPNFFAVGDVIEVTYMVDGVTGNYVASAFVVLSSGEDNQYTYQGELTAFTDTTWTVGDYTFLLGEAALPPYFGVGDIVEVTFKIVNGEYVAISVSVVETNVPDKTTSDRCSNRTKDHPAVLKLAEQVNEDPAQIMEYFCAGFGLGEIKLAYEHAEGSAYTPAMLLALRSSGLGWGEIKAMAAGAPAEDPDGPEDPAKPQQDKQDKHNEDLSTKDSGNHGPNNDHANNDHGNKDHKPPKDKGGKNK